MWRKLRHFGGIGMVASGSKVMKEKIYGIPLPYYVLIVGVIVAGLMLEMLPNNMVVGFTMCMAFGTLFNYIGNKIPGLNRFGGGTILAVLGPSLLLYFGILPAGAKDIAKNFFSGYGFSHLIIASLIVGSILSMKRDILIKAGVRFFIPLVGTLLFVVLMTGVFGAIFGYGFAEGALFVAGPIMGAGMGMSAIPLSEVYAGLTGNPADSFLTTLAASVLIANILTIIAAAILGSLGKMNPNMFFKGFSGEGRVLRSEGADLEGADYDDGDESTNSTTFNQLGVGFLTTGAIYAGGIMLGKLFPTFHAFLWMVVLASIAKIFSVFGSEIDESCGQWGRFMTKVLASAMLASISLSMIDIGQILGLLTDIRFVGLCMVTVFGAIIVAGGLGYLMGFYFVESAIMAGIGLADMGGAGDVAVLAAANRYNLLPFLQISSRIGGALNIFFITLLAQWTM